MTTPLILDALVRAMAMAPVALPPGTPDPEGAEARLASGIPGLEGERLITWSALLATTRVVADALVGTPAAETSREVIRRLDGDTAAIDGDALAAAALAGAWDLAELLLVGSALAPDTAIALLDYAARPSLRSGAASLRPLLGRVAWSRGRCPACGSPPALAVVHGKERERRLCCGRCGTTWPYERLRCPGCGERAHERLGGLHLVGEGEHRRADVCDGCRGYLKSIAVLDLPSADRVLTLDLETAGLDFLALEQGYRRTG